MQPYFSLAEDLKQTYSVFGHFYNIELSAVERARCRSVLEIFSAAGAAHIDEARRHLPDAIFVMMNPGSSRPLSEAPIPVYESHKNSLVPKNLVPTRPDTTQYQVMRVMENCGWSHVRVLNLSDLREAKSADFARAYKSIEQLHGFTNHSAFASDRTNELQTELLRKPGAPLVCAWGVSPALDPLLRVALPRLKALGECRGLLKAGTVDKYFHPLPTLQASKEAWLRDACEHLGSPSTARA